MSSIAWRPDAFGFPYEIGTDGSVRNEKTGQVRKSHVNKNTGYAQIDLWKNGKSRTFLVQRLVLEAFVGPMPPGKECSHINGNRLDNRLENLEYDTPQGNCNRRIEHGTLVRGSKHHQAKLTEEQVLEIWRLRGQVTQRELAQQFGVAHIQIGRIHLGQTWAWLTGALVQKKAN